MDFAAPARMVFGNSQVKPFATMSSIVGCLVLLALHQAVAAQTSDAALTNAADVLSLSAERAATGLAVSLEGVVTAAQPDWQGKFFIQDASAGIFVVDRTSDQPLPGDVVRVTGVTHPGGYAPIINQGRWEKVGEAPLPVAKHVSVERLMSGVEDSQRVEISGIVRDVQVGEHSVIFEIASGGYRFRAYAPLSVAGDPLLLVGCQVSVKGTAATSFHPTLRHLVAVTVYIPLASDLTIERSHAADPFADPIIPLDSVAQYHRDHAPGRRVHVRGTVTYQRPGRDLFLQDSTGSLQVKSRQMETLRAGDVVEAIGFADFEQLLPVLADANFRKIAGASGTPVARAVPLQELEAGFHHANLISVQGRLLDRTIHDADTLTKEPHQGHVSLTIQTSNFLFTAEAPLTQSKTELTLIPLGSIVELTGICMLRINRGGTLESGDVGTMQSLQILLPSLSSVRVLQRPSWLTPRRLGIGLGMCSAVLLLAIGWIVTVSRKNAALKVVVREKAKAQGELQKAHDELDDRVRERTAQLKFEMNARKEGEVRFKATLAERTRLAQELHDTLEQSLTGIGLQLDAAANLVEPGPDGAKRPLEMARTLMSRSQLELRRSIWDLRSRELEQFSLPTALETSAQEILEETGVKLEFAISGQPYALSEIVEENLLRIGREALANVIKHARASGVVLNLDYGNQSLKMTISDDGLGFTPKNCRGSAEGHFGLTGMQERAKRINGQLLLRSAPGQGTSIEVIIPATPAHEPAAAADFHGEI